MPGATPKELLPLVQHWHSKALAVIRTKDFVTSWQEFLVGWLGWNPQAAEINQAIALAQTIAIPDHPHHTEPTRQLLRHCAALQTQYGDRPFFLGCRLAGELIGLDKDAANKLLRQLQQEGFLTLVKKGRQQSVNGRLVCVASEWKCDPFAWGRGCTT
jgi:hypothetical protein